MRQEGEDAERGGLDNSSIAAIAVAVLGVIGLGLFIWLTLG